MDSAAELDTRQLRIVRRFKAPREMVFQAWTDSATFARWFGPDRYHTTRCELDVREGGEWSATMKGRRCFKLSGSASSRSFSGRICDPASALLRNSQACRRLD